MKSKKEIQKDFGNQRVLDIEDSKLRLDKEILAKLGILRLHISIAMVLIRNQDLDKKVTYAEIQEMETLFGATLPTQTLDGNTVTQSMRNQKKRL